MKENRQSRKDKNLGVITPQIHSRRELRSLKVPQASANNF